MKNQKAFTLVELLATLVILSVIMLVAVPSTMSMLDKNKKESFLSDAKRFVALAESEIRNNDKIDTNYGGFIVFRLEDLNDSSFDQDPDGHSYNQTDSCVVVYKKGTATDYQYVYYVQMYGKNRGISLTETKSLGRDSVEGNLSSENIATIISNKIGVSSPNIQYYKDLENIGE